MSANEVAADLAGKEIVSGGTGLTPEEMEQMQGAIHYLMVDDDVLEMLKSNPQLKMLIPAVSHMVRTANMSSRSIEEAKIRYRIALRLQLLVMNKQKTMGSVALFQTLLIYGYAALEDATRGYRGRLVTERIKTIKIEGLQKAKKGLFGLW